MRRSPRTTSTTQAQRAHDLRQIGMREHARDVELEAFRLEEQIERTEANERAPGCEPPVGTIRRRERDALALLALHRDLHDGPERDQRGHAPPRYVLDRRARRREDGRRERATWWSLEDHVDRRVPGGKDVVLHPTELRQVERERNGGAPRGSARGRRDLE